MRKLWFAALLALASPVQAETVDAAFAAFQRGYYATALKEATERLEKGADGPAMTLLGELYSNGLGVRLSLDKAREWYLLAVKAGDPQAMVALGMMALQGRGMGRDRAFAERMFTDAAKKDSIAALYNLGLMKIDEEQQDFAAAARHFGRCAELGSPDCQYALGALYKSGRGVEQNAVKATGLLEAAAKTGLAEAQIEFAIMQFNGEGTEKNEAAAADLFAAAARRGNPVAMNRLARILMAGRGRPKDQVEAVKWHLVARARGVSDNWLDQQMAGISDAERQDATRRARAWLRGDQTLQP